MTHIMWSCLRHGRRVMGRRRGDIVTALALTRHDPEVRECDGPAVVNGSSKIVQSLSGFAVGTRESYES